MTSAPLPTTFFPETQTQRPAVLPGGLDEGEMEDDGCREPIRTLEPAEESA